MPSKHGFETPEEERRRRALEHTDFSKRIGQVFEDVIPDFIKHSTGELPILEALDKEDVSEIYGVRIRWRWRWKTAPRGANGSSYVNAYVSQDETIKISVLGSFSKSNVSRLTDVLRKQTGKYVSVDFM